MGFDCKDMGCWNRRDAEQVRVPVAGAVARANGWVDDWAYDWARIDLGFRSFGSHGGN